MKIFLLGLVFAAGSPCQALQYQKLHGFLNSSFSGAQQKPEASKPEVHAVFSNESHDIIEYKQSRGFRRVEGGDYYVDEGSQYSKYQDAPDRRHYIKPGSWTGKPQVWARHYPKTVEDITYYKTVKIKDREKYVKHETWSGLGYGVSGGVFLGAALIVIDGLASGVSRALIRKPWQMFLTLGIFATAGAAVLSFVFRYRAKSSPIEKPYDDGSSRLESKIRQYHPD